MRAACHVQGEGYNFADLRPAKGPLIRHMATRPFSISCTKPLTANKGEEMTADLRPAKGPLPRSMAPLLFKKHKNNSCLTA